MIIVILSFVISNSVATMIRKQTLTVNIKKEFTAGNFEVKCL